MKRSLKPFELADDGENPFELQQELQDLMQEKAGIVRNEKDLTVAIDGVRALRIRAQNAGAHGNREYNPGWHTGLDLHNLLDVSEMIVISAIDRRESRGGHFHDDYPQKCEKHAKWNTIVFLGADGSMERREQGTIPIREDLQKIIEENQQ